MIQRKITVTHNSGQAKIVEGPYNPLTGRPGPGTSRDSTVPAHPGHAVSVPARLPAQRARLCFTLWPMLAIVSLPQAQAYNNNNNYTALQYSTLLYYPTTLVLVLYIP